MSPERRTKGGWLYVSLCRECRGFAELRGILTQRELVTLSLLFQRTSALDSRLLLLKLHALALKLLLHLAMAGVQLLFTLLQLALLLGNLLLEDHLHLSLHLGKLLLVQAALLLLLDSWVDLLEHTWILSNTHSGELFGTVVLVESVVSVLLELLHVGADKHLAKLDEVAVLLVVNLDDTPWVTTSADLAAIGAGDLGSGTDNGKWNLGQDLVVLGNSLVIIKFVTWTLEDLDVVELDIGKDLANLLARISQCGRWTTHSGLEGSNLLIGQSISLGNDWNQVDLGVKSAHDLDIKWLQRVASWLEEVDTSVDTVVDDVHAVDLVLGIEVSIESLLNVVDNWSPRLVVVDEVSETWGINNSKSEADTILLNICAYGLDRDGLWNDIERWSLALAWWVQRGVEESVDQGRLSEPGLAYSC